MATHSLEVQAEGLFSAAGPCGRLSAHSVSQPQGPSPRLVPAVGLWRVGVSGGGGAFCWF
jgi:hypothetical protein